MDMHNTLSVAIHNFLNNDGSNIKALEEHINVLSKQPGALFDDKLYLLVFCGRVYEGHIPCIEHYYTTFVCSNYAE